MSKDYDNQRAGDLIPVKFSRLTRRGILLGLSLSQLVALGIGVTTLVWAFYAGGGMLIALSAPVWLCAASVVWIRIAGRPIVEWIPVAFWWMWKTTGGQLLYRRRVVKPRPAGSLALPGDMARLREYDDPITGAGMVHDPTASTLTAIIAVSHPAFALLDPGEQERRVSSWGRVLATVCRSGRLSMMQVLERTLPDSGTGLAEWWHRTATQMTPGPRRRTPNSSTAQHPLENATPPRSPSRSTCRQRHDRSALPVVASVALLLSFAKRCPRSSPRCAQPTSHPHRG